MQNFTKLTDSDLHQQMIATSKRERELTLQMIALIEEASRRRFYLSLGFGTLFDYLTRGLGYSPAAAMRRISSARITRELPEVKEKILEGTLTLSTLSQADQFFREEKKRDQGLDCEQKREVLKQLEGQSKLQVERTLMALSSAPVPFQAKDKVKVLTPELTQISFAANAEFMAQLEEARGLLAHKMPYASIAEIMAELMKHGLAGLRKQKFKLKDHTDFSEGQKQPKVATEPSMQNSVSHLSTSKPVSDISAHCHSKSVPMLLERSDIKAKAVSPSKTLIVTKAKSASEPTQKTALEHTVSASGNDAYIPASIRRQVFLRDGDRCVVPHPVTGKPCGSQFQLELDHYPDPRALGGPSTAENLRVACRNCNLVHAVKVFGKVARRYLNHNL